MEITNQNKPYLFGMILLSFILIGAVFLFINLITDTVQSDLENNNAQIKEEIEKEINEENKENVEETQTFQKCLADAGFSGVIFLHSTSCGHCRNMLPTVQELVAEGYKIQITNANENSNYVKISNCMKIQNSVPQLICVKDGKANVGAVNKDKIVEFYNSC